MSGAAAELRLKLCVSCGWLGSESDYVATVPATHVCCGCRASDAPNCTQKIPQRRHVQRTGAVPSRYLQRAFAVPPATCPYGGGSHFSCWQKHFLLLPYFGLRTFWWSWWTDRFPLHLFGALTLRFGSHLLTELTITLGIISFKAINLWCYQIANVGIMRCDRMYITPTECTLAVPPTYLQGTWHPRSLQSKYAAAASSASRVRRWHRARTLEARLSWSRLALNLHLPAAQNRTGNARRRCTPCAARTCLLRSRRRRSARSGYCTLFNNRCVLSACSCVSQNTHRRRASAVWFSAFRLPNPTQTRRREVHGGLWPRL